MNNTDDKFQIISIDGGGVNGIISLVILDRIQQKFPNLFNNTDLFTGTSIGGLLSTAFAAEHKSEYLLPYLVKNIKKIFTKRHIIGSGLIDSKYSNKHLIKVCFDLYGEKKLKELKKFIIVPAFDINLGKETGWGPVLFNNFAKSEYLDERVADIVLSTTAAPYYFPTYDGYIDGGVVANNPSMLAISKVISIDKTLDDNIRLLSLGSGKFFNEIKGLYHNWGGWQWGPHILDIMFEGSNYLTEEQCKLSLGDNFCRINPKIYKNIRLDNIDEIDYLIDFATNLNIDKEINWILNYW